MTYHPINHPARAEALHSAGQAATVKLSPKTGRAGVKAPRREEWAIPAIITDAALATIGALGMWGVLNLIDRVLFGLAVSNAG